MYEFPTAHDVHIQLLYDRHAYLYDSDKQLAEKIKTLMDEIIADRPRANATAFEHLKYQYQEMRLKTLLGLINSNGVFTATVSYDVALLMELCYHGTWNCWVGYEKEYMEISTVSLFP